MAFNIFGKKETIVSKNDSIVADELALEDLDKVRGGYQKTQDDINMILAESEYIAEKRSQELDKMLKEGYNESDEKGYLKR